MVVINQPNISNKKIYIKYLLLRKKIFTLTFPEESLDTGSFWVINGGTTSADVDERDDVRTWLSSSSARFFISAWEYKRCDRKSNEGRWWFPRETETESISFENSVLIPIKSGPLTPNLGWNELLRRDIGTCWNKPPRTEKLENQKTNNVKLIIELGLKDENN